MDRERREEIPEPSAPPLERGRRTSAALRRGEEIEVVVRTICDSMDPNELRFHLRGD